MTTAQLKIDEEQISVTAPLVVALSVPVSKSVATPPVYNTQAARPSVRQQQKERARSETQASQQESSVDSLQMLPRKAKQAAVLVPALFVPVWMIAFLEPAGTHSDNAEVARFGMVLFSTLLFTLFAGAMLRSKRLGALTGGLIVAGVPVAAFVAEARPFTLSHLVQMYSGERMLCFAFFILVGAIMGLMGALWRQAATQLRDDLRRRRQERGEGV